MSRALNLRSIAALTDRGPETTIRLLTISGSLRAGSSNSALLGAVALVAPAGVSVSSYDAWSAIPAFSPDLEADVEHTPDAVVRWRRALADADAVLISSPEYAHGVVGALKNALDWVVGSGELVLKPVGLLSASSASQYAHPQLLEVLTVMNATVVPGASIVIDVPRRGASAEQLAADSELAATLRGVLDALRQAVRAAASISASSSA